MLPVPFGRRLRGKPRSLPRTARAALDLAATLGLLATLGFEAPLSAQIPPLPASSLPPGFAASSAFRTVSQPTFVRATAAIDARTQLVAVGNRVFRAGRDAPTNAPARTFSSDVTLLVRRDARRFVVGTLGGRLVELDPHDLSLLAQWTGVPNMFDAVPLPAGELLATANPLWPAPGAQNGVWHLRPGAAPREIAGTIGASGPLLLLRNGDLVVAEIGPIVPPPPGSVRLLRWPFAAVQAVLQGGPPLTIAQATEVAAGYDGIYDLLEDDQGRIFSTDPQNGRITITAPSSLTPAGVWTDLGSARFATSLQFGPDAPGTFRPWQPAQRAPELRIDTGDFASWFEVVRVRPERPSLTASPFPVVPVGPASLDLRGGPAGGVALWLTSTTAAPEYVALQFDGAPVWLAMPATAALVLGASPCDAQGRGTWTFQNPPGVQGEVRFQAIALSAAGVGSSDVVLLTLLP